MIFIYHLLFFSFVYASPIGQTILAPESKLGYFSGRVSQVHDNSKLLRIKTDFENLKYINKRNKVEFWHEKNDKNKCQGYVVGKSPEYLLLKVPGLNECRFSLSITPNSYLIFYSDDLIENIKIGRELVDILLKKRFALEGKLGRNKEQLEAYIEKVDLINKHYSNIIEKIERKRRKDLIKIEEERTEQLKDLEQNKRRLEEVNYKLQRYEIADENFNQDKWSLDPKLYFEK